MLHPELTPSNPHLREFLTWAHAARWGGDQGQSAVDQVLADHFLMDVVLCAISREAAALAHRQELRLEFWGEVVDFLGNYVHQIHRRKEEQVLFPALAAAGLVTLGDEVTATIREHQQARRLTEALLEGASDGDWESVIRSVSAYVAMLEPHLAREEAHFLAPMRARVSPELDAVLRAQFAAIEEQGLGPGGRAHHVELVKRMAALTGLTASLPAL